MNKNFELMLVLNPEVDEEKTQGTLDRVSRFITDQGGSIEKQEKWGMRRLAYPIKHFKEGNYILTRFVMNASRAGELDKTLNLTEEVIRHLLVKTEG